MMFRKLKLRRLINSVSKEDFAKYKYLYEIVAEQSEIVKKLYSKVVGQPIPENCYCVDLTFGKRLIGEGVASINIDIQENYATKGCIQTAAFVNIDDDITKALQHHGTKLKFVNTDLEFTTDEYIKFKTHVYDVALDSETYDKLKNLVDSF